MTSEMIDSLNKFIQISRLVNDYQLDTKLKECYIKVKGFRLNYRQGAYDYLNDYPCGYGDQFADNVNSLFNEWNTLKQAKRLKLAIEGKGQLNKCSELTELVESYKLELN